MPAPQRAPLPNAPDLLGELFTDARIEALNATLTERGIAAEKIISVIPVPGAVMANPMPPQFRVLYRTN